MKTQAAASGAAVGELPAAVRDGYDFIGWHTAAAGGEKVTSASSFDADATLYAQWTQRGEDGSDGENGGDTDVSGEYLITVDRAVGGTVRVNPGRADKGETVTITVTPKNRLCPEGADRHRRQGGEISVKSAGENRYTFEMPAARCVSAPGSPAPAMGRTCPSGCGLRRLLL